MRNSEERNQPKWNCAPAPQYRKGDSGNPRPKAVEVQPCWTAESWEGSTRAKGNPDQTPDARTQRREFRQDGLIRIREAAKRDRKARFSNLMHHITVELLYRSFCELKRRAAPGIDGKTWYDYKEKLTERLPELHAEIQSGRYRAKPSRRAWITKDNGEMRALGIAALEDKIVQYALTKVLESIYEVDFMGFSYGFRPGRSQHDALDALATAIKLHKINWVIDADIRKFFDSVNHEMMLSFVTRRIADGRVLRLIEKWLTAGVSEDGKLVTTTVGTPQGSVISPLLANIVLHYTFDLWIKDWRNKSARGIIRVVRYADDIVIGCQCRDDAHTLKDALFARFAEFKLELHSEKTRLIEFGRFAAEHRRGRGEGKPETFNFLGFTHICSTQKNNGKFNVLRRSRSDRMKKKLHEIKDWLKCNMHWPIPEQGAYLRSIVQGWFNYHAVPGNNRAISSFRYITGQYWFRSLRRRSQKGRALKWDRMNKYIDKWLPVATIIHPYPEQRFCVKYPR